MNKLKKIVHSTRGEGYIDYVIGIMCLFMVLVLTMNIYKVMVLKQDLDTIADQLVTIASKEGGFLEGFETRKEELQEEFFNFEVEANGEWWSEAEKKIDYCDTLTITVKAKTALDGSGIFTIPITATATRSNISVKDWSGKLEEDTTTVAPEETTVETTIGDDVEDWE